MTHGSLFSGIGGFDLAAEWMGWENKFHCEWNEFGQKVLHHYWPNAELFKDITKSDFTKYANKIDILTGGFPCQPYSSAGKRKGKEDERHLWPEMLRSIKEIAPRYIVGENVRGFTNWNGGMVFEEVCAEMESLGYQVASFLIPACGVNAPHKRERIWFVAYSECTRLEYGNKTRNISGKKGKTCREGGKSSNDFTTNGNGKWDSTNSDGIRLWRESDRIGESGFVSKTNKGNNWETFPTQSPICTGDDGISAKLDGITFSKWRNESIKAAGNAIVPQVVYQIFKAIEQYENLNRSTTTD